MAEGTKDVTQAEQRTDALATDTVLLINSVTQEVQQLPINELGKAVAGQTMVAPADFDEVFGV
ncbi:hypothetical protein [Sphingobacterium sp. 1.A.4]|uniref:hypothetical protein n=1 Tax=Sphingobacterium sp. 1.A.4 TaxID=2044603 RepID=UPI000C0BB96C|nr:hypothetical protein [Sphingobacterium sp. 1.A.4]